MAAVRLDGAAVARLLRGRDGPVMRRVAEVAQMVQDGARGQVGVSKPDPLGRPSRASAGRHLRDALVKRWGTVDGRPAVLVGAEEPHALLHHEGTRPHVIVPVRASVLVFASRGRTVYTRRVNHPGTRPNRYLTDPAARLGLRVVRRTL